MAIDPYGPCPCGSGKKVKFCCSDIVDHIETIQKMLEGEQRMACLEYVVNLEKTVPDRSFLLLVRSMLEIDLDKLDEAEETIRRFREAHPEDAVAHAQTAIWHAAKGEAAEAVGPLQEAIRLCGENMPSRVYEAVGMVAARLFAEGFVIAAKTHLMFQIIVTKGQDQQAASMLSQITSSGDLPLLLRDQWHLADTPEIEADWKEDFAKAHLAAMQGRWGEAMGQFNALSEKAAEQPEIWRNLAILRLWMADHRGAIEALRKYTAIEVSIDDAVEAEALVQLIDEDTAADQIDVLTLTYPVSDDEALWECLTVNPLTENMPIDLQSLADENQPPPRAAFWLLDIVVPETGVGISRADVPKIRGEMFLFGKQTDREARLEFSLKRTDDFEPTKAALAELCGDRLGSPPEEQVALQISAVRDTMSWNWRLPDDTPTELRRELQTEEHRDAVLLRWPALKMNIFDGKTPTEVSADPAQRNRLLAAILLLELSDEQSDEVIDYNELREQLGLPKVEAIDGEGLDAAKLSSVRLVRVDAAKLLDDPLIQAFRRAVSLRINDALRRLAGEVVRREHLRMKIDLAEAHGILAQLARQPSEALGHLERARAESASAGKSCAPWDMLELSVQISQGSSADANRLVQHIRAQHFQEPGIAQAMMSLLMQAGLINPDGSPRMAAPSPAQAPVGESPAASQGQQIWTPDGEAGSASGEKKAIWTPD
jgi:tetratricopeptide (TPR) repeat protein